MTLENRDLSKEGIWRETKKSDKLKSKYVAIYLNEKFTPKQFVEKYCPEWTAHTILYYRAKGYPPAECIVRYNAKFEPIHIPDVDYTWKDLYLDTLVAPTKKVRKAKQKRDKVEHKDFIKRRLIV